MKLTAVDKECSDNKWLVIDLDKRETISRVVWADDETGEYEFFEIDTKGFAIRDGDAFKTKRRRGNILLVKNISQF